MRVLFGEDGNSIIYVEVGICYVYSYEGEIDCDKLVDVDLWVILLL